jgi:hypothetical protein
MPMNQSVKIDVAEEKKHNNPRVETGFNPWIVIDTHCKNLLIASTAFGLALVTSGNRE